MRFLTRAALCSLFSLALAAPLCAASPSATQVNQPGFGNSTTTYSWSMCLFSVTGKLYVGTNQNFLCVETATGDADNPGSHNYSTQPDPCVTCAPDVFSMDLRGQIWSCDPANPKNTWTRVYLSPTIGNPLPQESGKGLALDIGYRDMIEYVESDNTHALYVGGVSSREIAPGMPLPRLLRSTDGITFTPVNLTLQNVPSNVSIMGFRGMTAFNGKMYLSGSTSLLGQGVLLESVGEPKNGVFRMISPPWMQVYEINVFNNCLYVGLGNFTFGYSVWKTKATGSLPYTYTPVVTLGGGLGPLMDSVVSMHVFKGALYVGNGSYTAFFPQCDMIRVNPDDTWDVIVGAVRNDPVTRRSKAPLSGLPNGFGNPYNAHVWRLQDYNGVLYAGTNDSSFFYRTKWWLPRSVVSTFGFDMYGSADGVHWTPVTQTGFGVPSNFGLRTMIPTASGLFIGSTNYCLGTEVFLLNSVSASAAPARFAAERAGASTVLSWEPPADGATYQVYRAAVPSVQVAPDNEEPRVLEPVPPVESFTKVGATTQSFFQDRTARPGQSYAYSVQAKGPDTESSGPSNLVLVNPKAPVPPVTFAQVQTALQAVAEQDSDGAPAATATAQRLLGLVTRARKAAARNDLATARKALEAVRKEVSKPEDSDLSTADARKLELLSDRLLRRVKLAEKGVLKRTELDPKR